MRWPVNRRLLILGAAIGFCCIRPHTFAQTACDPETALTVATDEFNAGHFSAVEPAIKSCLDNTRFTKEQLVRAYQLLTQTYLILDNAVEAEKSYLNLLKANPEYISSPDKDPIDVVYLSKKFTATPIFSWAVHTGPNITLPRVIVDNKVYTGSNQQYLIRPRGFLGGTLIWNYNDRITAEVGVDFTLNSFALKETNIFQYDNLTVRENQFSVQVPLSVKYTYIRQGISPYGYAGVSVASILTATQNLLFVDQSPNYVENSNEILSFSAQPTERDQNVRYRRSSFNRSFHFGGGFRWKYKLDYLFVDIRYSVGMNNISRNNRLGTYAGTEGSGLGSFSFAHVDDYMRLDQAMISVGFIRPLYKPRKLKHARTTKTVLRDIKKEDNEQK
jgi:hypothetical protein